MNESIFEWMEQVGWIDKALLAMAIIVPLLAGVLAFFNRHRRFVKHYVHRWLMAALIPILIWVLWILYNKVIDLWGLDSLLALGINLVLFGGVSVIVAVSWLVLERKYSPLPNSEKPD